MSSDPKLPATRCAVCNLATGKLSYLPNTLRALGKEASWAHTTCVYNSTAAWARGLHQPPTTTPPAERKPD